MPNARLFHLAYSWAAALYRHLMYGIVNKRLVQTAYLFASFVLLTTVLILDMASMAIMPLMARFV